MIKLMSLVRAARGVGFAEFRQRWDIDYLTALRDALPRNRAALRIVHNHVLPMDIRDDPEFTAGGWAGVGEAWFEDQATAEAFLADSALSRVNAAHADALAEISYLLCKELPTWDEGLETSGIKMLAFFHPSAAMTREESQWYWTHEHVRVGSELNDPKPYAPRYVQNHTLPDFHAANPAYDYAGCPELWFHDQDAAQRMFREAKNLDKLAEDEARFSDRKSTVFFVTDEVELFRSASLAKTTA